MSHTAGPWKWFDYPDGRKLLAAPSRAVIHCPDAPISCDESDARLIAAAPELLAALKRAVETIRIFHGIDLGAAEPMMWDTYQASPEMHEINAAIAKAEGR